jgi:hypothetical protein
MVSADGQFEASRPRPIEGPFSSGFGGSKFEKILKIFVYCIFHFQAGNVNRISADEKIEA